MDDNGHHENGRSKPDMFKVAHSQWLMQQPQSMKQIMNIMAERDAAIHKRDAAINEKNKAYEERDLAIMQRDSAIQQKNQALIERDNAMSALNFQQNLPIKNSTCPPGCQISRGVRHMHHPTPLNSLPLKSTPTEEEKEKPRKVKRSKDANSSSPNKKTAKSEHKMILNGSKTDWKGSDQGLNQVAFDETTMAPPVCSCTGTYRQCYKWGNGGWQSSCCTMTISMYPLPAVPNKKHARVGGRKMSGSAFSKLLSRLSAEGFDLSTAVDLKDHWAKHGTNRYITIR